MSLRSGRRLTASERLGRERERAGPSRTQNAGAGTQGAGRPGRFQRRTRGSGGAVAIRAAHPGVLVVTEPFPVPRRLVRDELDARQPLDALVAVHLGNDDARRRAVRTREWLAVHAEREEDVMQA